LQKDINNKLDNIVKNSGNSDVDLNVNIEIDTKAIAYGMLCSLYAKGELTEQQLDKAIQKLHTLIDKDKKSRTDTTVTGSRPKLFEFPTQTNRRKWL